MLVLLLLVGTRNDCSRNRHGVALRQLLHLVGTGLLFHAHATTIDFLGGIEVVVVEAVIAAVVVFDADVVDAQLEILDSTNSVLEVVVDENVAVLLRYCLIAAEVNDYDHDDGVLLLDVAAASREGAVHLSALVAAVVQKTMDAMPMEAFSSPSLHDDASAVDDDVDCHHCYDCPHHPQSTSSFQHHHHPCTPPLPPPPRSSPLLLLGHHHHQ